MQLHMHLLKFLKLFDLCFCQICRDPDLNSDKQVTGGSTALLRLDSFAPDPDLFACVCAAGNFADNRFAIGQPDRGLAAEHRGREGDINCCKNVLPLPREDF